jgi:hypothetical protein
MRLQHLRKNDLKSVSSSANGCIEEGVRYLGRLGGFDLDPFLLFTDGEQNPCIAETIPHAQSEWVQLACRSVRGHMRAGKRLALAHPWDTRSPALVGYVANRRVFSLIRSASHDAIMSVMRIFQQVLLLPLICPLLAV